MVDLQICRELSRLYEFVLPEPTWQLWFPTGNQKSHVQTPRELSNAQYPDYVLLLLRSQHSFQ